MIFKNRTCKGHKLKRKKFPLIQFPLIIFMEGVKKVLSFFPHFILLSLPDKAEISHCLLLSSTVFFVVFFLVHGLNHGPSMPQFSHL